MLLFLLLPDMWQMLEAYWFVFLEMDLEHIFVKAATRDKAKIPYVYC